jgi:hypothetical protein
MERKPFVGRLKILLQDQPTDSCPVLDQEQVARIPYKLFNVLSQDCVSEDLGDMGIVVRVRDKLYQEPLKRTLQWITRGDAADFLTTRKFDVVKSQGDSKCDGMK